MAEQRIKERTDTLEFYGHALESLQPPYSEKKGDRNLRETMEKLLPVQDEIVVVVTEGSPGSGKSHTVEEFLVPYIRERGVTEIIVLPWDKAEQKAKRLKEEAEVARQKGRDCSPEFLELISNMVTLRYPRLKNPEKYQTKTKREIKQFLSLQLIHNERYPYEFIFAANVVLRMELVEQLKKAKPGSWLIVDKPGGTTVPGEGLIPPKYGTLRSFKRDYDTNLLCDLHSGTGMFKDILRDSFRLGYVGVVPGPWLDVLVWYRHEIQEAESLEAANEINSALGYAPFDMEGFKNFRGGGSSQQVLEAELSMISSLYTPEGEEGFKRLDYFSLSKATQFALAYLEFFSQSNIEEIESDLDFLEKEIGRFEKPLADILHNSRKEAKIMGDKYPMVRIRRHILNLISGRNLVQNAEKSADEWAIIYNDPSLNIPDEQKLRELIVRHGLNSS